MAGSLLGPDQIRKVNATFPTLVAHIRALLVADHTGVGLMKVHCMVETFDSDEMARIFRELSFISPIEKKALVRAAIYELMVTDAELFVSPEKFVVTTRPFTQEEIAALDKPVEKLFTPPSFKLNVTTSGAAEMAKTDTKPEPKVTSTHESIVAKAVDEGNKRMAEQAEKLEAAVAKLRESSMPKVVGIDVAADGKETTVVAEVDVAPNGDVTVVSETQTPAKE